MTKGFLSQLLKKMLPALLCLLVLLGFVYMAVLANIDLAVGRYALDMDERITFDGVRMILHPDGLRSFIHALAWGDQRYGRSLWISIASFSFLPERIWGDAGQIIAGRMLQVFLIASSCGIWLIGILRNWPLRLVLITALLAMPYSDYYMSMPKPEPLQLFFLSLFCYFYFRKKLDFGWYWIFAGLAFGTKISTLPAALVFAGTALFINLQRNKLDDFKSSLKTAAFSFSIGLAAAVPILCLPLLLGILSYHLLDMLKRKFQLGTVSQCAMVVVSVILVAYLSRRVLRVWIDNTFLNTTHGADQKSINYLSWIRYFFEQWLVIPSFSGILFFALTFLFIGISALALVRSRLLPLEQTAALSITLAGLGLNLAIFVGAHRLWGFYLYPGTTLMIAGLLLMIDLRLAHRAEHDVGSLKTTLPLLGGAIAIYLLGIAVFAWAPATISKLQTLAHRTDTPVYAAQYESYRETIGFLDNYAKVKNKTLKVKFTPSLFPPDNNANYEIIEFWGPYTQWDEKPDVIIFGSVHTSNTALPHADSPEYEAALREHKGYALHVVENGAACKATPCFEKKVLLPLGSEILTLKE